MLKYLAPLLLLGVCLFGTTVRADLPVHCLNTQVSGKWVFEMGHDNNDNTIHCGHHVPDLNSDHFTKHGFPLAVVNKMTVSLEEPNIAIDEEGNRGTWTMVYDEGFEVFINGKIFFAFSKYVPKTPESLNKDDVEDYTSICEETLVGWFHNDDGSHWGCYHGRKVGGSKSNIKFASEKAQARNTGLVKVLAPSAMNLPAAPTFAEVDGETTHEDQLWEPSYSFIEAVNSAEDLEWRAGVHKDFLGKRMSEMEDMLGERKSRKQMAAKTEKPRARPDNRPEHIKYASLPSHFDWRNKGGVNFDSPVRNQGNCGSCYAMASVQVAEARIRVKSNGRDTTIISPQAVVSCSIYNQGCDGGYPYLVAKHAMDFGLVPDSCMSYTGTNGVCKLHGGADGCSDPSNPPRYFASNYSYIGGYYGFCSEVAMMEEIYRAGPIMVAFDAPSSLFYYQGGVYTGAAPPHEGPTTRDLHPWEKTNHAVIAVGWGVSENGTKYWIIKNTWGPEWGENGYFRIRRGTDECGIESMAVTMDIELPKTFF